MGVCVCVCVVCVCVSARAHARAPCFKTHPSSCERMHSSYEFPPVFLHLRSLLVMSMAADHLWRVRKVRKTQQRLQSIYAWRAQACDTQSITRVGKKQRTELFVAQNGLFHFGSPLLTPNPPNVDVGAFWRSCPGNEGFGVGHQKFMLKRSTCSFHRLTTSVPRMACLILAKFS